MRPQACERQGLRIGQRCRLLLDLVGQFHFAVNRAADDRNYHAKSVQHPNLNVENDDAEEHGEDLF